MTGADMRSPSSQIASAAATSGSTRLSVPAAAAVTRPRPVTKHMYATAVAATASQTTSATERGAASAGSSASVHGSSADPPASSVTDTAAVIPAPCPLRILAATA
ncbi:MAG TPA: hypothetical protein VIL71_17000 [Spirillospora sp.]